MDGPVAPDSGTPSSRLTSAPAGSGHAGSPTEAGTARSGRAPVRTCIGCRKRGERSDLVRLVALGPTTVVVDERRSAPGRGGWLHTRQSCLELALRRGTVARALRLRPPVDTTAVARWMALNGAPVVGS